MIRVSVVIATYKRPKETAYCLELLQKSQFLGDKFNLEVIVVDSSPDNLTENSIEGFREEFDLNYIKLRKKTLPGEARNMAIKKTKYELVIILDSDIEIKPETIWQMIEYLKTHPRVARMTGKSIFASGSKKGEVDRPTKWDRKVTEKGTVFIEGIYGRYEAFYKSAFLKIGGYDLIFGACGEGTDISIRFWRAGFPLGIDENIVAYHNTEAPESLRRTDADRMTAMYRSLFLVAYKYDVGDIKLSPNFIKSNQERYTAYGESIEFHSIVSVARSIEWFKDNYQKLVDSKKHIPQDFDFKPFDIFTNISVLKDCLNQAKNNIKASYDKTFGNKS